MAEHHPDLDPTDPRWRSAEFGAQVQDYVDAMTPAECGRFRVHGWIVIAEVEAPDGPRSVMTLPYDRHEVPRVVGMLGIAQRFMERVGTAGWGVRT